MANVKTSSLWNHLKCQGTLDRQRTFVRVALACDGVILQVIDDDGPCQFKTHVSRYFLFLVSTSDV